MKDKPLKIRCTFTITDLLHKAAVLYAAEHELSFSQALRSLLRESPALNRKIKEIKDEQC